MLSIERISSPVNRVAFVGMYDSFTLSPSKRKETQSYTSIKMWKHESLPDSVYAIGDLLVYQPFSIIASYYNSASCCI
jgi:hypothetical protein